MNFLKVISILNNIYFKGKILEIKHHTDARSFLFTKNAKGKVIMRYKARSQISEWSKVIDLFYCIFLIIFYFKKRLRFCDRFFDLKSNNNFINIFYFFILNDKILTNY